MLVAYVHDMKHQTFGHSHSQPPNLATQYYPVHSQNSTKCNQESTVDAKIAIYYSHARN